MLISEMIVKLVEILARDGDQYACIDLGAEEIDISHVEFHDADRGDIYDEDDPVPARVLIR